MRLGAIGLLLTLVPAASGAPAAPLVSVWYRGSPAGHARQDDLAVIRALGFTGVVWPARLTAGAADFKRMAGLVDLAAAVRRAAVPLTPALALAPDQDVDVMLAATPVADVPALVWRAVAHGARRIAFDAGRDTGAGVTEPDGSAPAWLRPAQAIARQISSNAELIAGLRPGPAVRVVPAPPGLDVVLLDGGRVWVIVATNLSARVVNAVVRLPKAVPYAIWVSLIDGSDLGMLGQPTGPMWRLSLEERGVRVYAIDKTLR
jgi:hypothetical protein